MSDDFGNWEVVYNNPWWKMLQQESWYVLTPTSGESGSCILLIDALERVLLVHVPRRAIGDTCLELPRGGIDPGETPEAAAVRECHEETGVTITEGQLVSLGVLHPDSGILRHQVHLYYARLAEPFSDILAEDPEEIVGHEILSMEEFREFIRSGIINDAFTIAAESRYAMNETQPTPQVITVYDKDRSVIAKLTTPNPQASFDQFCRNRDSVGWTWE